MKFLTVFAIGGLLFVATPAMSGTLGPLEGVTDGEHRIVALTAGLKEELRKDPNWRVCGDYFARKEKGREITAFFIFEKGLIVGEPPKGNVFTFTKAKWIGASANTEATPPTVLVFDDIRGDRQFWLKMSLSDYATWLSCFGKGQRYAS
jgi:hypothetical protein